MFWGAHTTGAGHLDGRPQPGCEACAPVTGKFPIRLTDCRSLAVFLNQISHGVQGVDLPCANCDHDAPCINCWTSTQENPGYHYIQTHQSTQSSEAPSPGMPTLTTVNPLHINVVRTAYNPTGYIGTLAPEHCEVLHVRSIYTT